MGAAHNRGVDNLNTTFNYTTFADDNVGANLSSILYYGSLVNNSVVFAFFAELSLSHDVSSLADQVVSRLTNVHPESLKLELENFTITRHLGENFALNWAGPVWNTFKHRFIKQVETGIDVITYKLSRFLDKAINLLVFFCHYNAVFAWVLHLGHSDSAFSAPMQVSFNHLVQRKIACNIGVEHEDLAVFPASAEEIRRNSQGSSSSHGDILNNIMNFGVANLKFD